jgi:hypothetical protein
MRDIVEKVVEFFSSKLQSDTCDKKKALVDEFMATTTAAATTTGAVAVVAPKKVIKKREISTASKTSRASSECCGKCAYIIKKKNGELEVCGKNAKNELDGKFYCGSVDKAGHYQSTIKQLVKKPSAVPSVAKTPGGVSPSSSVAANSSGSTTTSPGAQSLLHKLQQQRNEKNVVYKIPGTEFFIIREKRILMNIKLNEAYGILAEDNKTVNPLDSAAIAYLKEKNISFTTLVKDDDDEDTEVIEDDEDEEADGEDEVEGSEEEDE